MIIVIYLKKYFPYTRRKWCGDDYYVSSERNQKKTKYPSDRFAILMLIMVVMTVSRSNYCHIGWTAIFVIWRARLTENVNK